MAVPKKKTSKSKRNMRRSGHALPKINAIPDSETGDYRLPHHMSSGRYKNRLIIEAVPSSQDNATNA